MAESVGLALLVVLDTLSPAERLAFVLHDMFAVPFDEIATILGRSPNATKQLASRARQRVQAADATLSAGVTPRPDWSRPSWLPPATATSPHSSRCWIPRSCSAPTPPPSKPVRWQRFAAHPPSQTNSPNAPSRRYPRSWSRHPAPSGRSLPEHRAPRSGSRSGTGRSFISTLCSILGNYASSISPFPIAEPKFCAIRRPPRDNTLPGGLARLYATQRRTSRQHGEPP